MADHPHTIDRWDDATGENLIEQIAAVGDYLIALATYRAAVRRWPKDKITLRNRARVLDAELGGLAGRPQPPRRSLHRSSLFDSVLVARLPPGPTSVIG